MKHFIYTTMVLLLIATFVNAQSYSGGSGTEGGPFQINNLNDLRYLSEHMADWTKHFIQTADINASITSEWNGGMGFSPIGNGNGLFEGSYNGLGYFISNLYINNPSFVSYSGLFGYVTSPGTIKNLGITNANITGQTNVGALIGDTWGAIVENCYSTGNITGGTGSGQYVGGLVGMAGNCSISNCYSSCNVNGGTDCGGFSGSLYSGTISNCYSTGNTTRISSYSSTTFGAFCGSVSTNATIENCYSIGDVIYEGASNPTDKGFVGLRSGSFIYINNFFDKDLSNQATDEFGVATPKTTADMKAVATFTATATVGLTTVWDFETNPNDDLGNNNYWDIDLTSAINSGYPFLSWENGNNTALPVELTIFTVEMENNTVKLNWETATEVNNYGFEIERQEASIKNQDQTREWKIVGFVQGYGNSNSPKYYDFIDVTAPAKELEYRLKQIDTDGKFEYYNLIAKVDASRSANITLATEFALTQNYPNPFNPTTVITYSLVKTSNVVLKVYNSIGQEVAALVNKREEAGKFNITFNASNLPSGVYFYSIRTDDNTSVKKMLLLR